MISLIHNASRQPSGVSPSNQHLPSTSWSMQCECPVWSHQGQSSAMAITANALPRSSWRAFTTFYLNTSFSCNYNEFLSGLAYQYNQHGQNFTWWGRCTRFHGYFIRVENCHDSAWRLPDGEDNLLTVTLLMTALHGVKDYPVQQSSNLLPSGVYSGGGSNRREKKFQECAISPS